MRRTEASSGGHSSLQGRLLFANIALVGTTVACLVGLFVVTQRTALQRQIEARAGLLAEFLASDSELPMLVRNLPELERTASNGLANEDVLYVVMADPEGRVLARVARPGFPLSAIPSLRPAPGSAAVFEGPQSQAAFIDLEKPVSTHPAAHVLDWEAPKSTPSQLGS